MYSLSKHGNIKSSSGKIHMRIHDNSSGLEECNCKKKKRVLKADFLSFTRGPHAIVCVGSYNDIQPCVLTGKDFREHREPISSQAAV